ncbi:hypothetical protein AO366_1892 [Moraxella catarrhalis]|uniref:Uncharacterized protein n=2 Tax=Moraxella catarrhalis TaxID=480 RepID=A0A198UIZ4_MORCA|nr:hypothetical protein EJK52_0539 [Moraxella catarrhalis]AZQ88503.1 hypothetical protein EJK50_0537 [Moraxella catarrhalis]AZQ90983.1 hypothetical protein EJK51_0537 [Moraxella catarrhalis]OAU96356.1 hypothetical protein AO384_1044 [Moraxella catarrhalis]OAU97195.1 hypothetical protein AO383_1076 [Moraxella catarrhalis]
MMRNNTRYLNIANDDFNIMGKVGKRIFIIIFYRDKPDLF